MPRPSFVDLSALFAGAIALAGSAAGGCGPCRVTSFDYEKVLPSDEVELEAGVALAAQCESICGPSSGSLVDCREATVDGEPSVVCLYEVNDDCGGVGRMPPGMSPLSAPDCGHALGRHFALVAELEAASVHAFEHLETELRVHRAPRGLCARARQAARDERRHAAVTATIARRFGGAPSRPRVARAEVRSLEALALDNALEGCVRETMGAAVAGWQARHAADRDVARAMRRIALDETRHAELGWRLHAWLRPRLAAARVRSVEEEARHAALALSLSRETARELRSIAGFPSRAEHRRMARHLAHSLWGTAT